MGQSFVISSRKRFRYSRTCRNFGNGNFLLGQKGIQNSRFCANLEQYRFSGKRLRGSARGDWRASFSYVSFLFNSNRHVSLLFNSNSHVLLLSTHVVSSYPPVEPGLLVVSCLKGQAGVANTAQLVATIAVAG